EDFEGVGQAVEEIINNESGLVRYDYGGEETIAAYTQVPESNWFVIIAGDEAEIFAEIPRQIVMIFAIVAGIVLVSIIAAYIIGREITNPVLRIVAQAERLSELDISQDISDKDLNRSDEIGTIFKAFQLFTSNLRDVLKDINQSSEHVSSSSQELMATTQESATASEEVSKTVEEIAKGASEQAINTEEGAQKASWLGESIEQNLDNT